MFTTAHVDLYRQAELIGFIKDYLAGLATHNTTAVSVQVNNLQASFDAVMAIYKKSKGSDLTPVIQQLDQERDKCVNGIKGVARDYTNYFIPAIVEQAHRIVKSMDKYNKNIVRLNYQAETTVILNLLEDWKTAEFVAAFNALHLTDWKNELERVNNEFIAVRAERTRQTAEKNEEAMKTATKTYIANYRTLNQFIFSHNLIAPSDNWAAIAKLHNALAEEYNMVLKRREGISGKTKTEE